MARKHAAAVGAVLLVVDTLPQFAGLKGDAENNSGAALEAIAPLQLAAANGLAVLIIRHDRKGGGEVGDSARGSSAFAGAVDVVLQIQRGEGNARPSIRVINALSRFSETPDQLMIELTDSGYVALGDKTAVAADEAREALQKAAPTSEGAALTEKDLLEMTEVKRTVAQEALRSLVDAGVLLRIGEGKRGSPYRYWKPEEKLFAGSPVDAAERNHEETLELVATTEKDSAATSLFSAAERNGHRPGIWVCDECHLPRSFDDRPCPNCGATTGEWMKRPQEAVA
jgi:rubrerythrin